MLAFIFVAILVLLVVWMITVPEVGAEDYRDED